MSRLLGGTTVDGMSGEVSFDANGDTMVPWAGLNVQNRTMVPVMMYTPSLTRLTTAAESPMLRRIVWPGSTTVLPSDHDQGVRMLMWMALLRGLKRFLTFFWQRCLRVAG